MTTCTQLATLIPLTLAATAVTRTPDTERKVSSFFELGVLLLSLTPLVKRRKTIFLFLVFTILSSISTVAFVTANVNTVFAKRSRGGSDGTDGNGGGG